MLNLRKFINPLIPIIIYIFSSCTADETLSGIPSAPDAPVVPEVSVAQKNALLNEYAIRLAVAVRHPEVRAAIRQQALLKEDGDYDVLVKKLDAKRLNSLECTVGHLMAGLGPTGKLLKKSPVKSISGDVEDVLTDLTLSLQEVVPNAQVSVPVHCEEWDPATYEPMVAVLPYDYNEDSVTQVMAYDSGGEMHLISTLDEPDVPVLVVGRSERVNEDGTPVAESELPVLQTVNAPRVRIPMVLASYPTKLQLNHGFARSLMLEWEDVADEKGYEIWRMNSGAFTRIAVTEANENNYVDVNLTPNVKYWYKVRAITADGFSSWSPIMATTASNRTDNEWLKIKRMRFSTSALRAVESWISGSPEIRLRVIQGSVGGASNVYTSGRLEPNHRGDICNAWWNREIPIFAWSTSVYGTVLTFDWREEDWTDNVDFALTGSYEDKTSGGTVKVGGTVQVNNDDGGDVIGNTSVMWWQDKAQTYDLSGFQWQFAY